MLRWWLRGLLGAELLAYGLLAYEFSKRGVSTGWILFVIGCAALAWRASHALGSFTVAAVMRSRDGRQERSGTTLPALWSEFFARLTSYNWSQPFSNLAMPQEPAGGTTGMPILLVHGYFSNRGMWLQFRSRLIRDGFGPIYTIDLGPPFGDIDHFATQLAARFDVIRREAGDKGIHVVAHSMGGLVSRAYLANCRAANVDSHVQSLTTLGSPHHGTRLAAFGIGGAVKQMRDGSGWLTKLAESEQSSVALPATLSIYTLNDDLVYPPETSELPWAINLAVDSVGHVGLLFSEAVYHSVKQQLTSKDGQFQAKMPENARQ